MDPEYALVLLSVQLDERPKDRDDMLKPQPENAHRDPTRVVVWLDVFPSHDARLGREGCGCPTGRRRRNVDLWLPEVAAEAVSHPSVERRVFRPDADWVALDVGAEIEGAARVRELLQPPRVF